MDGLNLLESPAAPPKTFAREGIARATDTWAIRCSREQEDHLHRGFWADWSSSSPNGTIEKLGRSIERSSSRTTSKTELLALLSAAIIEFEQASSIDPKDAAENVFELRRITGYSWEKLASLLNVDRRTLHNWINGSEIREQNRDHIAKILRVLRYMDRGNSEENAIALDTKTFDLSAFEALKAKQYDSVQEYLGRGNSRRILSPNRSNWIGEFSPTMLHVGADGTERLQPLPHEKKPAARKRKLTRQK